MESIKTAVTAAAANSWRSTGNRRGYIAIRRADHCYSTKELLALNVWISVGWEGLDAHELAAMDDVIAREQVADRAKRRKLEYELERLNANRSDRASRDSIGAKKR